MHNMADNPETQEVQLLLVDQLGMCMQTYLIIKIIPCLRMCNWVIINIYCCRYA